MNKLLDGVTMQKTSLNNYQFRFHDKSTLNATMADVMLYTLVEQQAVMLQNMRQIEMLLLDIKQK